MAPKCAANRACSYVCRFYWTNIWVHRVHRVQPVFVNTPNCDNMGYYSLRVTHRQSQEVIEATLLVNTVFRENDGGDIEITEDDVLNGAR